MQDQIIGQPAAKAEPSNARAGPQQLSEPNRRHLGAARKVERARQSEPTGDGEHCGVSQGCPLLLCGPLELEVGRRHLRATDPRPLLADLKNGAGGGCPWVVSAGLAMVGGGFAVGRVKRSIAPGGDGGGAPSCWAAAGSQSCWAVWRAGGMRGGRIGWGLGMGDGRGRFK